MSTLLTIVGTARGQVGERCFLARRPEQVINIDRAINTNQLINTNIHTINFSLPTVTQHSEIRHRLPSSEARAENQQANGRETRRASNQCSHLRLIRHKPHRMKILPRQIGMISTEIY